MVIKEQSKQENWALKWKNKHVRNNLGWEVKEKEIEQVNGDYYKATRELKDQGFRVEENFDAQQV